MIQRQPRRGVAPSPSGAEEAHPGAGVPRCPQDEPQRQAVDERLMREALKEAAYALEDDEVPVGAVVAHEGRIIARAHNQREQLNDPTAHAEMIAITQAAAALSRWRLTGSTLYVTLEPCAMCAGAMVLARIDRLVYGAADPKAGACGSLMNIVEDRRLNHRVATTGGVLAEEAAALLREFFRQRRLDPEGDTSS